jgi:hypothetical protein
MGASLSPVSKNPSCCSRRRAGETSSDTAHIGASVWRVARWFSRTANSTSGLAVGSGRLNSRLIMASLSSVRVRESRFVPPPNCPTSSASLSQKRLSTNRSGSSVSTASSSSIEAMCLTGKGAGWIGVDHSPAARDQISSPRAPMRLAKAARGNRVIAPRVRIPKSSRRRVSSALKSSMLIGSPARKVGESVTRRRGSAP